MAIHGQSFAWSVLWTLVLAVGSTGVSAAPSPAQALVQDYVPPRYISWERYVALSRRFDKHALGKGVDSETPLQELLSALEPDATLALLRILVDPQAKIFYGSYTDPADAVLKPGATDYSPSPDGLVGLRVVRQTTVKGLLLSSIQTYLYRNGRFFPADGVDSLRLRMQIAPYKKAGTSGKGMGVIGFSWRTIVDAQGRLAGVLSEPYTTRDRSHAFGFEHPMMKFPNVTPCGLATHCNGCHHRDELNTFSEYYGRELQGERGYREMIAAVLESEKLRQDAQAIRKALLNPKASFPTDDLVQALRDRWEQIRPEERP